MVRAGRHTGGQDRVQNLEIDPQKISQLIFDKGTKVNLWRKGSLLHKVAGPIGHS